MKKAISVLLAVIMLFAVCVPAFAADITNGADGQPTPADPQKVDVFTKTTNEAGEEVRSYTVTIPADVEIAWGDTKTQDVAYHVTSQLQKGESLKVKIDGDAENKMKPDGDEVNFLSYTLTGGDEATFGEVNNNATASQSPTISVDSFDGVPVAVYKVSLTYTVTYEPAKAA